MLSDYAIVSELVRILSTAIEKLSSEVTYRKCKQFAITAIIQLKAMHHNYNPTPILWCC